ncbi:MAG: HEAT repeat domain-containing protein [Planctomycetes bacterium]|nr:HEAT repeat domain-containing protein [Planctomycetota bacterium]
MSVTCFGCAAGTGTRATPPTDPYSGELPLLAALQAESPRVRETAAYYVGRGGDRRHVEPIGALVDDADFDVRMMAIRALGFLTADRRARRAATPFLLHALGDGVWEVRLDACSTLAFGESDDWTELEGCLADSAALVRLNAAVSLATLGESLPPRELERLFTEFGSTGAARMLVSLLGQLREPAQLALLELLDDLDSPSARFAIEQTRERLQAVAAGKSADWRTAAQCLQRRFREVNDAAFQATQSADWTEVDRAEILAAARTARFVVCGEMHSDGGPLRRAQCELLRAFAATDPKACGLGFEPSVETAQQSVISLARELGMQVLPLEQNWRTLNPEHRYAERDDEAAATIRTFLDADPRHRLFVIRGQSHLLPGGYLLQQVGEPDLAVFEDIWPTEVPLRFRGREPTAAGRTFRLGEGSRRYVWACDDGAGFQGYEDLRAWLQAWRPQASATPR